MSESERWAVFALVTILDNRIADGEIRSTPILMETLERVRSIVSG